MSINRIARSVPPIHSGAVEPGRETPHVMIVYATEDERHRAVQEEALELARLQPARLVLYDAGAGSSSPRATRWSGETDGDAAGGNS